MVRAGTSIWKSRNTKDLQGFPCRNTDLQRFPYQPVHPLWSQADVSHNPAFKFSVLYFKISQGFLCTVFISNPVWTFKYGIFLLTETPALCRMSTSLEQERLKSTSKAFSANLWPLSKNSFCRKCFLLVFAAARFPTGWTHSRGSEKVDSIALHSAAGHEHCKIHSWQLPPESSPYWFTPETSPYLVPPETSPYLFPPEASPYQSQTAAGSDSPSGPPAQTGPMGPSWTPAEGKCWFSPLMMETPSWFLYYISNLSGSLSLILILPLACCSGCDQRTNHWFTQHFQNLNFLTSQSWLKWKPFSRSRTSGITAFYVLHKFLHKPHSLAASLHCLCHELFSSTVAAVCIALKAWPGQSDIYKKLQIKRKSSHP